MLRRPAASFVTLGLLVALSTAATAQGRPSFWLSFGPGYGSANSSCDNCFGGPRLGGTTAALRVGGTLSRQIRLGVGIDGWSHSSGGIRETLETIAAFGYYYPRGIGGGLFVAAGLGYSHYQADTDPEATGGGVGCTVSVGDDVRVGRHVALTPSLTYSYGDVGKIDAGYNGTQATGWTQNFVSAGVAVTLFSGRGAH